MNKLAFAALAVAAAATAFAANAPETFAYLWVLKGIAAASMGIGSLLLHPPGSPPAVKEPEQPVLPTWQVSGDR